MIESLHIEDLGVIEEADLPLSRGLTALTGETGAGKTMVLTSLGLLLGQRAETTIVRSGAERSLVEGAFLVDPESRVAARVVEAGGDLDDALLLASRTVPASGRSRAYLGGRSVPASVLSEVGGRLVSVHGQADQLRLRSTAAQRAALDSLGGQDHAPLCRRYAQAYQARRQADQELQDWQASAQARAVEVAQLRTWLEALEEVDPRSGEDRELTAEAERLDHAEDLRRAATGARTALSGEESATGQAPDVVSLIAYAHRSLSAESDRDPALAELATRTQRLGIDAADIAAELGGYLSSLSADPARLAQVQDRRGELARACREIGGPQEQLDDVDALLAWGERAAARLAELDGPQDTAAVLAERLERADALAQTVEPFDRWQGCARQHFELRQRLFDGFDAAQSAAAGAGQLPTLMFEVPECAIGDGHLRVLRRACACQLQIVDIAGVFDDAAAEAEADNEVFQIGRGHQHHRLADAVVGDRQRDFLGQRGAGRCLKG